MSTDLEQLQELFSSERSQPLEVQPSQAPFRNEFDEALKGNRFDQPQNMPGELLPSPLWQEADDVLARALERRTDILNAPRRDPSPTVRFSNRLMGPSNIITQAQHAAAQRNEVMGPPTIPDPDPDMAKIAVEVLLSTGIGMATGGAGIPVALLAQFGGLGAFEALDQMATGKPVAEAIALGTLPGGRGAAGEALGRAVTAAAPPAVRGIGRLIGAGRRLLSSRPIAAARGAAREAIEAATGRIIPAQVRAGRLRAPFRPRLEPGAEEALAAARSVGGTIPPGNLVQSKIIDTAQQIAEASLPPIGTRLEAQKIATERLLDTAIQETVNRMPRTTRQALMSGVQDYLLGFQLEVKGVAQGMFRQVDNFMQPKRARIARTTLVDSEAGLVRPVGREGRLVEPVKIPHTEIEELIVGRGVDIRPLKAEVQRLQQQAAGSPEGGLVPLSRQIQEILAKPDVIPYEQAQRIRSDLFDISGQFNLGGGAIADREAKDAIGLSSLITRQINNAISKAPNEVRDALSMANRIWAKEIRGELSDKFVQKLLNDRPDDLLDAIISNRNVGQINRARKLVNRADPTGRLWQRVEGMFVNRILQESSEAVVGPGGVRTALRKVNPTKMIEMLDELENVDGSVLQAMLPKGGTGRSAVDRMRWYANALKFSKQGANARGQGSVFFQLMQAGAIGGAVTGLATGTLDVSQAAIASSVAILPPAAIAGIFSDDFLSRWLSVGVSAPPGSKAAARALVVVGGGLLQRNLLSGQNAVKWRQAVQAAQQELGIEPGAGLDLRMTPEEQQQFNATEARAVPTTGKQFVDLVGKKMQGIPQEPTQELSNEQLFLMVGSGDPVMAAEARMELGRRGASGFAPPPSAPLARR